MLFINLLLFAVFVLALIISATVCVKALEKISAFLRLSEFVVAFIIMAFSTSLPELFVGISSALANNSSLLLGTIIGSNIANLALVAGVMVLIARGIKVRRPIRDDTRYMLAIVALPLVLMLIGRRISRIDGALLIIVFVAYQIMILKKREEYKTPRFDNNVKRYQVILSSFLFILAIIALFFSADGVVKYGTLLSVELALPAIFIGIFFVAVGTSLPELAFGAKSAYDKKTDLSLGNLIGSVIVNSTLIIGITAIINPIMGDFFIFITSATFMMLLTFIFLTFVESGNKLDWREGLGLLLLYVFFIIVELSVSGYGLAHGVV